MEERHLQRVCQTSRDHTTSTRGHDSPKGRDSHRGRKKEEYIQNFVHKAKAKSGKGKKVNTTKFKQEQKQKWILETFNLAQKPCLAKAEDLEKATNLLLK